MKCPYHVSFIQQQTLLASITRANNMLLIWFQEAVSRQLRFQLLSSAERTQNVPVPLPQESWQRGAHSCQLSQRNKEKPKQVFLTKRSLTVLTQGKPAMVPLGMSSSTSSPAVWASSLQRAGARSSRAGGPRHCCGSSSVLPHAHLLPQLAFHKFPASSCALQFYSTQNQ